MLFSYLMPPLPCARAATSLLAVAVPPHVITTQVVKSRGGRMYVADMLVGLAAVARRLYPNSGTPSSAFYQLVSDRLLPWILRLGTSVSKIASCTVDLPTVSIEM